MSVEICDVVNACASGDFTAFDSLWVLALPALRACVKRYVIAYDDQEDVLQQARITAFDRLSTYKSTGSLQGWLTAICRTTSLMYLRTNRRFRAREQAAIQAFSEGYDELYVVHDSVLHEREHTEHGVYGRLQYALEELTERQRQVVVLRVAKARSSAEVSRLMGCRESTVRVVQAQALAKLRRLLVE